MKKSLTLLAITVCCAFACSSTNCFAQGRFLRALPMAVARATMQFDNLQENIRRKTTAELERQKRLIRNMLDDLGPIKAYLDDPEVTDIAIQDSGEIIISRFGRGRIFTGKQVGELVTMRIIKSVAACVGIKVEAYSSLPKLEAFIPTYNA